MAKRRETIQHGTDRLVSYLRVSTDKQGIRGLGIEAQRHTVLDYVRRVGPQSTMLGEYVEVESGRRSDRPELWKAIDHARNAGATLVIAKLDRLSRDVHFLTGLEKAGVEFVACDLPNANRLTVTILAAVAEHEREMISQRTKAALQVARERVAHTGQRQHPAVKRLGNPNGAQVLKGRGNAEAVAAMKAKADVTAQRLLGIFRSLQAQGITTVRSMARALNERGVLSPNGQSWHPTTVVRVRRRLRTQLNTHSSM
jgi:DNA invertase Pin-like site-specific DNA recombinase